MSKYLSREEILAAQDLRTDEVETPEWAEGGTVLIRELSAAEVDQLGFDVAKEDGSVDLRRARGMRFRLVAWGVIDEDGNNLFSVKDAKALGKKSRIVIDRIAEAVMKLSGLGDEDDDEETEPKNE